MRHRGVSPTMSRKSSSGDGTSPCVRRMPLWVRAFGEPVHTRLKELGDLSRAGASPDAKKPEQSRLTCFRQLRHGNWVSLQREVRSGENALDGSYITAAFGRRG
jgi:hypothetical protein